ISQLVQHPALDAATSGFKKSFEDAGVEVDWDEQNANGEQANATSIAQNFASSDLDLVLAVATPAAQAAAQAITDKPVLFTAVTDPVEAGLVQSNEAPGGNVTGTSDLNPVADQLQLVKDVKPDAKTVGIVYSSGEVNSQVQVDLAKEAAKGMGLEIKEA
ncbi:sugar ABC transporter substrate-binding protein, partial [Geobacillus sp. MMMUD3]|nr:sugar ABC transporter substrate-binding protein [Geobacillus sp. MMMUD3]